MINGKPNDFLDTIYSCQDINYLYHGIQYWFQGYMPDEDTVHMEIFQYKPPKDDYIWEFDGRTIEECMNAFLKAPIFDGKTFWQAEQDIEWTDD
jgi:hypothetical protein